MATTTKESFNQFATNLNITDNQGEVVSNCRKNVVGKISKELSLYTEQSSKLIGSYDRDTLIRYLTERDVDVMVVLNYGANKHWDSRDGAIKVLDKFKEILENAYPDTDCKIDRNCITMNLSKFRLDVVPAFKYEEGYYAIPDTYRRNWLKTDPVKFAEEITRINKNMGGSFIPLIKMMKGWNRKFKRPLRGFHLECIMLNHYKNYKQGFTYDSMAKVFFEKLPVYLESPANDPITGDRVDLYMDNDSLGNRRIDFISRARKTSAEAKEAFNDTEKYPIACIKEWKEIFGEFFPAYG